MKDKKKLTDTPQKKSGVTEMKKIEISSLGNQLMETQNDVMQLQVVVTALAEKSEKFQSLLAAADDNREKALSNKNLMDEVLQNARILKDSSETAFNEMMLAGEKTAGLVSGVTNLANKLVFTSEVIDKLANLIIRKRALNPLISDELVSLVTNARRDAGNVVALTLVALKSAFESQAVSMASGAAASVEHVQAIQLYEILTGTKPDDAIAKDRNKKKNGDQQKIQIPVVICLRELVDKAYTDAVDEYNIIMEANQRATVELNGMNAELNKMQVKLKSLQAGLAAANTATIAS